jgi:hypothetical protein
MGERALKVDKSAGFFAVSGAVGADDSVLAEDVRIAERRGGEKPVRVLARLGARYVADFKERAPVNTLDIVPASKPGAFKVFYQGKLLAKAKLDVIAESGWKREFKTDEQGAVEAALPWRGTYVIEVQQRRHARQAGRGVVRRDALCQHAVVPPRRRPARSADAAGGGSQAALARRREGAVQRERHVMLERRHE